MPEISGAIPPAATVAHNNIKGESSSTETAHSSSGFHQIYDELSAIGASKVAPSENHGQMTPPQLRKHTERDNREKSLTQAVGAPIGNHLASSESGQFLVLTAETTTLPQPQSSQFSISHDNGHEATASKLNTTSTLVAFNDKSPKRLGVESTDWGSSAQGSSDVNIEAMPSAKDAIPNVHRVESQNSAAGGLLTTSPSLIPGSFSVAAPGSTSSLSELQTTDNIATAADSSTGVTTAGVQIHSGRQARVSIELNSDSLGSVKLNLAMRRSGLAVNVALDSLTSLASLTRSKDDLRHVLESSGAMVSSLSLHLNGGDAQRMKPNDMETHHESGQDAFTDTGGSGQFNGNDNYSGKDGNAAASSLPKFKEIEPQISSSGADGNRNLDALYL